MQGLPNIETAPLLPCHLTLGSRNNPEIDLVSFCPEVPNSDRIYGVGIGLGGEEAIRKARSYHASLNRQGGFTLKLYGSHRSPYVQKVRVFIREKGIPCDFLDVRPASAEVVALNPLSQIPTLELDNGSGIFDSTVIVDYIDGAWPEHPLIPQKFAERIEVRRWEALCDGMSDSARMIKYELSADAASQKGADYFAKHRARLIAECSLSMLRLQVENTA